MKRLRISINWVVERGRIEAWMQPRDGEPRKPMGSLTVTIIHVQP
jgi:hypothetical protein